MTAAPDLRVKQIRAIKASQRQLRLDDTAYRLMLKRVTGKDSCAAMNSLERAAVIEEMKRQGAGAGRKPAPRRAGRFGEGASTPQADTPLARKIRALWLSLHNLGEVDNPGEGALIQFVRRQAKVDALQWISPRDADKVIEALKSWLGRAGVQTSFTPAEFAEIDRLRRHSDVPPIDPAMLAPKVALLHAQWARLRVLGAFTKSFGDADLSRWLTGGKYTLHPSLLELATADAKAETLGRWIRREQKKGARA
jgi:phage gp16-like protein